MTTPIQLNDSRTLDLKRFRGEVEIWLIDSLTRSNKKLATYRGGKYIDTDPELFRIINEDKLSASRLFRAIKNQYDEPTQEVVKRWTCFKRSIVLKFLMIKRSI